MNYVIKLMKEEDLKMVRDWTASEGWNPGIEDYKSFQKIDPNGFFLGYLDGEPITSIGAVDYDGKYGFVGWYITKPEYRGKGYGFK